MENIEVWKDIIGFEDYKISDFGRVKSLKFGKERILKKGLGSDGYHHVILLKEGKQKSKSIHSLVAESFLNHKTNGRKIVIDHIDNNRLNNYLYNLRIIPFRENCNKKHLKSSSEYTGVFFNTKMNKFSSQIYVNGKQIYLGSFENELEASLYYQNALKSIENNTEIIVKKTKFKGCSFNKQYKKWESYIHIKGIKIVLGYFDTELEAHLAYEKEKSLPL